MRLRTLLGAAGLTAALVIPAAAVSAAPTAPAAAPTAPSTPRTPSIAPGHSQVTVTWTAPASTGGSPVTAYRVRVTPGNRTVTVAAPATSTTVTGLADGTSVTATVVAINQVGTSAAATAGSAIPVPPITRGPLPAETEADIADLAMAPDGTFFIATDDAILRRAPGGTTFTTLPLGTVTPWAIAVGASGELYWADQLPGHIVIKRYDEVHGTTTVAGSTGPWPTTANTPAPALEVGIPSVLDLAVNHRNGSIYILDYIRNTVYRFTVGGNLTVAAGVPTSSGSATSDGDGGPAAAAHLNGPQGLAISEFGDVYIAETWGNRVRHLDDGFVPDDTITTVAGNGTTAIDPAPDLAATATGVPHPARLVWMPGRGLLIDSEGRKRLLVDDRLRRIGGDAFDRALFDSNAAPGDGAIGSNDSTLSLAWDGSTLWGSYVVPGYGKQLRAAGTWLPASTPTAHPGFGSWSDLVVLHHRAIVGRPPTTSEHGTWVAALTAGAKTPGQLDDALRRSADNTANVDPVVRLYRAFLGRAPDAGGLRFWIARKRNVAPARTWKVSDLAAQFTASSEFQRKYGTLSNRAFVTRIYTDVLGRAADTAGVDFWTKRLDTKRLTRAQVMVNFSESSEYQRKQAANTDVAVAYLTLVGRMPTATETSAWVTAVAGGQTHAELLDDLVVRAPELV